MADVTDAASAMKPVASATRVRSPAFKVLMSTSMVLCLLSVAGASLLGIQELMTLGFPLSLLPAVVAIVAHGLSPKRELVLLDVRGDDLFITSRAHPLNEIGRVYRAGIRVPIGTIARIETGLVYVSRLGSYIVSDLTRLDGTTERVYFTEKFGQAVHEFFRRLHDNRPHVEVVDGGARFANRL